MSVKPTKTAASKSEAVEVEPALVPVEKFRPTLETIAFGRLCACRGDHDEAVNDCPRTIARRALGGA